MSLWSTHVVPVLVEKACRSRAILDERTRWIPEAHGNVLEVGVGSGDHSPQLLAKARTRIADASVPVELVEASAEQLPFDARSFDSAVDAPSRPGMTFRGFPPALAVKAPDRQADWRRTFRIHSSLTLERA